MIQVAFDLKYLYLIEYSGFLHFKKTPLFMFACPLERFENLRIFF